MLLGKGLDRSGRVSSTSVRQTRAPRGLAVGRTDTIVFQLTSQALELTLFFKVSI